MFIHNCQYFLLGFCISLIVPWIGYIIFFLSCLTSLLGSLLSLTCVFVLACQVRLVLCRLHICSSHLSVFARFFDCHVMSWHCMAWQADLQVSYIYVSFACISFIYPLYITSSCPFIAWASQVLLCHPSYKIQGYVCIILKWVAVDPFINGILKYRDRVLLYYYFSCLFELLFQGRETQLKIWFCTLQVYDPWNFNALFNGDRNPTLEL